jgi:hypothetical protein
MAAKKTGTKQKLSPKAAKDKAIRDKKYAMSESGKFKKRDAQKKRAEAKKRGVDLNDKDYDHTKRKLVSVKANRSGHGKGTRNGVKNGQGKKNK